MIELTGFDKNFDQLFWLKRAGCESTIYFEKYWLFRPIFALIRDLSPDKDGKNYNKVKRKSWILHVRADGTLLCSLWEKSFKHFIIKPTINELNAPLPAPHPCLLHIALVCLGIIFIMGAFPLELIVSKGAKARKNNTPRFSHFPFLFYSHFLLSQKSK